MRTAAKEAEKQIADLRAEADATRQAMATHREQIAAPRVDEAANK